MTAVGERVPRVVAVNQPYIFPYLGYFQLLRSATIFVAYDDVQWIKSGWINRNRILHDGKSAYLTLPVAGGPSRRLIRDVMFAREFQAVRPKLLRRLKSAYRCAPFFADVMPLVEACLGSNEQQVCRFALNALRLWCDFLGITTRFVRSSELVLHPHLRGEERVLAICGLLGASGYVNLIGGRCIYNDHLFSSRGIELRFVQTRPCSYAQVGGHSFVPDLSIIDVAMNNSPETLHRLLQAFDLVRGSTPGQDGGCLDGRRGQPAQSTSWA